MSISRREFLKIGGLCALGVGAMPLANALAGGKTVLNPRALTAKSWGMVVNSKNCVSGCTDCITACHKVHNVPNIGNSKEEIKWIWQEKFQNAFPYQDHQFLDNSTRNKNFVVLCNHCESPSCVRVCPTKATFKRADGIIMMDYHRCIGCRYCIAACPYGARSFNFKDPRPYIEKIDPKYPTRAKGVVEKCNFCDERIGIGLQPACVEACKYNALVFGDLGDANSEPRKLLAQNYNIQRKVKLGTKPKVYYIV